MQTTFKTSPTFTHTERGLCHIWPTSGSCDAVLVLFVGFGVSLEARRDISLSVVARASLSSTACHHRPLHAAQMVHLLHYLQYIRMLAIVHVHTQQKNYIYIALKVYVCDKTDECDWNWVWLVAPLLPLLCIILQQPTRLEQLLML